MGAYFTERMVAWGQVVHDIVEKMWLRIGKTKGSFISPFLFHLYKRHNCLSREEVDAYEQALTEEQFNF